MKQPVMARVFSCSPIFAMGVFIDYAFKYLIGLAELKFLI